MTWASGDAAAVLESKGGTTTPARKVQRVPFDVAEGMNGTYAPQSHSTYGWLRDALVWMH